jgi:sialate O-acetylesterase
LIDSSVGGTPAEAWTSRETLESSPELKAILDRHAEAVKKFEKQRGSSKPSAIKAPATTAKKTAGSAKKTAAPADPSRSSKRPSGLYNAMIAPLQPYAIAGVIWYQGEANSGRAAEYATLFPAMIGNWRQAWKQGEFPFLFVQIAPHERMTPEIREAQLISWRKVHGTSMVVITDHGEEKDIHPKAKEPVGSRLALAARAIAYGEKLTYSGPVCESAKIEKKNLVLTFSHVDAGLVSAGDQLKGFEIAGPDEKFVPAQATIEGDRIVLSADGIDRPSMARYGWAKTPDVNLFNKAGLPATPFRITVEPAPKTSN